MPGLSHDVGKKIRADKQQEKNVICVFLFQFLAQNQIQFTLMD